MPAPTPLGPPVTPVAPAAHPPAPVPHPPAPVAAPVASPVLSRAPLPAQHLAPQEDPRTLVRLAVGEALAPVQQAFRDIQRRLEELERRPLVVAPAPVAPAPALGAMRAPQATVPGGVTATGTDLAVSMVPVSVGPVPVTIGSLAPRPPVLDVAAIERDASVTIDGAIDGRRRKLRLVLTFVLLLLLVFGGLFAALANSYTPHTSGMAPPRGVSLVS
jgi:hypothetical protein